MKLTNTVARACFALLILPLSGCLYEIGSKYGYEYPIKNDGTVDMSVAPDEDVLGFSLTGFLLTGGEKLDLRLQCFAHGRYWEVGYNAAAATGGSYKGVLQFTGRARRYQCSSTFNGDGTVSLNLAVKVGTLYVPILSKKNMDCITSKVQIVRQDYLTATKQCIALDPRGTSNPFGLNETVEGINELKLKVSVAFYHLYLEPLI